MPKAEQITAPDSIHGEGPVWSTDWDGLRWVDMLAGDVLHLDPRTGEVSRWHVGKVAAALRPRTSGGAVIATEREFLLCDQINGPLHHPVEAFTDRTIRFNEGTCDPAGNFLCGTMAYDESPGRGTLYRLNPHRSVEIVLTGITISNGLCWTADAAQAYYVDTPTGQIDVFDSDHTGQLSNRRKFAAINATGTPDGLTVDSQGGVWVALWGGGAVHRYSPAGALDEIIYLPVPYVTACTFGGDHLDELYITTSQLLKTPDAAGAGAGALFRAPCPVTGQPAATFCG